MSAGGLSIGRLDRMHEVMTGYVERNAVPGIVTLVARHGEVIWSLMREGLVDEYRLFITPTVRGHGKRLFPDGINPQTLQPVETRVFDSGVVMIRCRPVPDSDRGGTQ
jgi:dihydrofolate reductase